MNKKGLSLTTGLVYGLVSLFALTVLYLVIVEYAIVGNVLPIFQNILAGEGGFIFSESVRNEILGNWDRLVWMMRIIPSVLFLVVVIFMFVLSVRKEQETQYYG
jgi:hypothetical protein